MIRLDSFKEEDFDRLINWVTSEKELIQFAGPIFSYPLTHYQLEKYIKIKHIVPKTIVHIETGKIIGHCELNFKNKYPRLSRIFIGNKKYRGKGLGKIVLKLMLEEIRKTTLAEKIDLYVFEWNKVALNLYKKEGFIIQPKKYYFKYKHEVWTNLYMINNVND